MSRTKQLSLFIEHAATFRKAHMDYVIRSAEMQRVWQNSFKRSNTASQSHGAKRQPSQVFREKSQSLQTIEDGIIRFSTF